MKSMNKLALVLALGLAAPMAQAGYALDTGATFSSSMPSALNGASFFAAEFTLGAGQTITDLTGYMAADSGSSLGDTFTIALYGAADLTNRFASSLWSAQASFTTDGGWNGLHNLGSNTSLASLGAGNYWLAFEVGGSDSTSGLLMPSVTMAGTAPALAYAFNDASGYQSMTTTFGAQVVTVPEPESYAMLLAGLGLMGFIARRRTQS